MFAERGYLFMSSMFEEEDAGGAERPSGVADESQQAVTKIVSHIVSTALDANGKLSPDAEFQIAVRDPEKRGEALEKLLAEVCPSGVMHEPWIGWLNGGQSPFKDKKLEWVGPGHQRPSRTLTNWSRKVKNQGAKVEKLRRELALEEEQLEAFKSVEDAALHWHVADHLLDLLSPVFAMGPAWAIMRAIAPHLSDELAHRMTLILEDDKDARADAIKELREKWKVQSNEAMEVLDFFAGNPEFEGELRGAILDVTYRFSEDKQRRAEWQEKGGRRRSKEAIRTSINPEAKKDAEEIIDSFF